MYKYYLILFCTWGLAIIYNPAWALRAFNSTESLNNLRTQAMQAYLHGKNENALMLYDKALNLAVKQYGANSLYVASMYFDMGAIALHASKFQKAENYLNQAVRINPASVSARLMLSSLLRTRGRPDEAMQQATTALSKQHNSLEARQEMAFCYLDMGKYNQATMEFSHLSAVAHGKSIAFPEITKTPESKQEQAGAQKAEVKAASFLQFNKPAPAPVTEEKSKSESKKPKEKTEHPQAKPAFKPLQDLQAFIAQQRAEALAKRKKPVQHTIRSSEPRESREPRIRSAPGGLVPPPPPVMPVYQPFVPPPPPMPVGAGNPGFQLKTEAKINSKAKPKAKETSEGASGNESAGPDNSDFLLDWASDKNAKKK